MEALEKYNPEQPRDYHGRWVSMGASYETKARDAVLHIANKFNDLRISGATVFHFEGSGKAYDLYNESDREEMHKFLPREELYVIARTNNTDVPSATESASQVDNLHDNFKENASEYRGTSTGGWTDEGRKYIDHGVVLNTNEDRALGLGKQWDQQAVTYIDNRGLHLRAKFITVSTGEEQIVANYVHWLIQKGWYDDYFTKGWVTIHGAHIFIVSPGEVSEDHITGVHERGNYLTDRSHFILHGEEKDALGSDQVGDIKVYYLEDHKALLSWMGVREEQRGKGVGTAFYSHVENKLRDRGVREIELRPGDTAAAKFWRSRGYDSPSPKDHPVYIGDDNFFKDISKSPAKHEEEESIPEPDNFVVNLEFKKPEVTEKAFWDFLLGFFSRADATAGITVYGIDAANSMQDQEYVVWQTAEDEKVCNYCGPLDFKVVSTEEFGDLGYPPVHVNCRCTVVPYSDIYGDKPPKYYHSAPKEYDPNSDALLRTRRIELSLVPYFRKAFNPDQPRDEHGRWTGGGGDDSLLGRARIHEELSETLDRVHDTSSNWDSLTPKEGDSRWFVQDWVSNTDERNVKVARMVMAERFGRDPIESEAVSNFHEMESEKVTIGRLNTEFANKMPIDSDRVAEQMKATQEKTASYLHENSIDKITVYRGIGVQPKNDPLGNKIPEGKAWVPSIASWTTDRNVAESFANKYGGRVIQTTVSSDDVIMHHGAFPKEMEHDAGLWENGRYTGLDKEGYRGYSEDEIVVAHKGPYVNIEDSWKPDKEQVALRHRKASLYSEIDNWRHVSGEIEYDDKKGRWVEVSPLGSKVPKGIMEGNLEALRSMGEKI